MPAEKIMIVDDERLVRWSLRQKCEEWGYQVIEAEAGEAALRLAAAGVSRPRAARRAHARPYRH